MDEFTSQKEYFIQEFKECIVNNINLDLKFYGVSLAPICIYDNIESDKNGKACIVLGRERDGINKNMFNFFGGKIEKDLYETKEESIAGTIFDEVLEELGVILTPKTFERSIIKFLYTQIYDGYSIIIVSHIIGLSNEKWQDVMSKRLNIENLEWKYQEMSEIDIIAIEDIQINFKNVSKYVRGNIYSIIPCYNKLSRDNLTLINVFKTT
jgi:hypothetical protein